MDKMRDALERAKMLVGMEFDEESAPPPPEEQSFFDDINRHCALNTTQESRRLHLLLLITFSGTDQQGLMRLYGFAICLAAGLTCTFLSMLVFFNPVKFGVTFTLGNAMALGSTAFLIGPKRQFDMMLDPVRIYATAIYIASIIVSLFCALLVHSKLLTLLAIILEFGALIWYSLSYIPFARSVVSKVMASCFETEF
uniref:Vesicle transport protein n=1 Tax=Hordeum vulgare subsp. vulgare TaxID=112509 RepID=A0A8I6Y4H8_HORVV